jgi:hypothetical protein
MVVCIWLSMRRSYGLSVVGERDGENLGSSDSGIEMLTHSVSDALIVPAKI